MRIIYKNVYECLSLLDKFGRYLYFKLSWSKFSAKIKVLKLGLSFFSLLTYENNVIEHSLVNETQYFCEYWSEIVIMTWPGFRGTGVFRFISTSHSYLLQLIHWFISFKNHFQDSFVVTSLLPLLTFPVTSLRVPTPNSRNAFFPHPNYWTSQASAAMTALWLCSHPLALRNFPCISG